MGNYVKHDDEIAFHPGYYLREIIHESGLTQEDFAIKLGIAPQNLCMLVKGEQRLSGDIAEKLSGLLGTTIEYWINIQKAYDEKMDHFYAD